MQPLAGVTVVEFGTSVAAPYAGMILADLGARVVKVENPDGGDHARGWGPPFWRDISTVFRALNRGKHSVVVDFSDPAQAAALRDFIATEADGVIQNLRPGVLVKFGLDEAALRPLQPKLLWCDVSAFGAEGPLKNAPGYDPLVQAMSGIMSVTGTGDGEPVRVGVSIIDIGTGMWTVIGFLAALLAREKGQDVTTVSGSLYETGLAWMTVPLAAYAATGEVRKPYGSGLAEIVPYQAFDTIDGRLMVAAGNDGLFARLCAALGAPDLAQDPKFARNQQRIENRDEIVGLIARMIRQRATAEFAAALDAAGVPNAPLLAVDQVTANPQTWAVGMLQAGDDGIPLVGLPISFDGVRPRAAAASPALGAHTGLLHPTHAPLKDRAEELQ